MNAYKLNSAAVHAFRKAIQEKLNVPHSEIYKVVDSIEADTIVLTKDGRQFEVTLVETGKFETWLHSLPLITLTDELKDEIIEKFYG